MSRRSSEGSIENQVITYYSYGSIWFQICWSTLNPVSPHNLDTINFLMWIWFMKTELKKVFVCGCEKFLPGPAWLLLSKTCKDFFSGLSSVFEYDSSLRTLRLRTDQISLDCLQWMWYDNYDMPFKQARDLVDVPPLFTELLDLQKYDDGCLVLI